MGQRVDHLIFGGKDLILHLGVSTNRGILPPKWMVYFMETPI